VKKRLLLLLVASVVCISPHLVGMETRSKTREKRRKKSSHGGDETPCFWKNSQGEPFADETIITSNILPLVYDENRYFSYNLRTLLKLREVSKTWRDVVSLYSKEQPLRVSVCRYKTLGTDLETTKKFVSSLINANCDIALHLSFFGIIFDGYFVVLKNLGNRLVGLDIFANYSPKEPTEEQKEAYDKQVTDKALYFISKTFPNLRKISFCNCNNITPKGMRFLAQMPKLSSVAFKFCPVTDEMLRCLAKSQTITNLSLKWCKNVSGSTLHTFTHLKALHIERCKNFSGDTLHKLANLKSLHIEECENFDGSHLEHVTQSLQELNLIRVFDHDAEQELVGQHLMHIARLADLKSLDLTGNYCVKGEILDFLPKLKNLREANFAWCPDLDPSCLPGLVLPSLKKINCYIPVLQKNDVQRLRSMGIRVTGKSGPGYSGHSSDYNYK
jgi:hypothetical protein